MTCAVVDTNVLVSAVVGRPTAAPALVLRAYFEREFQLAISTAVEEELLRILLQPDIRDAHDLSDDQILEFVGSLRAGAKVGSGSISVPPSLPRDPTDTKFLALALESKADYLVTQDARHLLRLGTFEGTRILTPA